MMKPQIPEFYTVGSPDRIANPAFVYLFRLFMTDRHFAGLSLEAKVLYLMLLDRMNFSSYSDERGRIFLSYPMQTIADDLGVSRKTAIKYMMELCESGLVVLDRDEGYASRIYVLCFGIFTQSWLKERKEEMKWND